MPQANITYDAPYNHSLISKLDKVQREKWQNAFPAFTPSQLGYRLGAFHGEVPKVGGGSTPLKYNPAGNSPAYPPMVLSSGLAVSSGGSFHQGARYSGVDGAIEGLHHPAEGGRFNFGRALGSLGKVFAPIAQKVAEKAALSAVGLGRKKGGSRRGKAVGALSAVPAVKSGAGEGGARGRSARAEIVKKVMREKGMKMIEASKYVKQHNLY